jgi:histidine ammonia-lyase
MNLLEYNAERATIELGQRELLLVMALVQEGRESFGCNTQTGKALDEFFSAANVKVEEARRQSLQKSMVRQKISTITTPQPELNSDVSHG